jgi:hypothetical protein
MRAFIVVGQAPAKVGNPSAPLEGRIGQRLAELFGCSYDDYLRATQRFNILPEWPGANAKGDRFPMFVARTNAGRMSTSFGGCYVLVVGVGVGKAFGLTKEPVRWHKRVCPSGAYWMAVLPHLSGINRWWNDRLNRERAARFMQTTWALVSRAR